MQELDIHLDNEKYVEYLLNYLRILQEGRIKPNTNKDPNGTKEATVRDSIDNLQDINAVKDRLNFIFGVDITDIINRNNN